MFSYCVCVESKIPERISVWQMVSQEQVPKLLDEVRRKMRLHHYSIHIERSYRRSSRSLIDHAILHYETHLAERFNFLSRIASHGDEIGQQVWADAAELVFHAEDL